MTSQPSGTQPDKSTSGEDHPYISIIKNVPTHLNFLLDHPDVNYDARSTSRPKLRDMMELFGFKIDLPKDADKTRVVNRYRNDFLPGLLPFLSRSERATSSTVPLLSITSNPGPTLSQTPGDTDLSMRDASAMYVEPNAKSSTKGVLFGLISPRVKAHFILPTMSRPDMIKLFHKFVNSASQKPAPCTNPEFVNRPHAEVTGSISGKDRDVIRHAIQCYAPHVFVPLGVCNMPVLLKLYELFVQGNEDAAKDLCEGVHYHVINPNEVKWPEPQDEEETF
jgi:hypothetical protein